jgi:hypothetical protein
MADQSKPKAARPRGSALDLPMTLLAAGSVGFAAFAMPADLFESLVTATGLPGLVAAAQPPLGGTARIAFVAGGALLTFALVWSLLRALSRPAVRKAPAAAGEAPRLRRADMHPDAPARAPIRAASDFAVPLDPDAVEAREPVADMSEVENVDFEAEWERPAPAFLQTTRAEPVAKADQPPKPEPEAQEPAPEVPFWVPETGEQPIAESEPDQVAEAADDGSVVAFWPVEAEPARSDGEPRVDQLVSRLEGGLIRRKREGGGPRRGPKRALDDRLASALDDLNKMSSRRS